MEDIPRMTAATVDVLRVLVATSGDCWGLRVIKESGRPAGSVYPILERLETAGWLASNWEQDDNRTGPRRRFYTLTAGGAEVAVRMIARFEAGSRSRRPGQSGVTA